MSEYSQGICHDGAVILKDGAMMTVDDVVAELSRVAELEKYRDILEAEVIKRTDRIAELEAVMKELADDVEAYAGVEFSGRDIWPTYQRKWELAMDVVNRARALLGVGDE